MYIHMYMLYQPTNRTNQAKNQHPLPASAALPPRVASVPPFALPLAAAAPLADAERPPAVLSSALKRPAQSSGSKTLGCHILGSLPWDALSACRRNLTFWGFFPSSHLSCQSGLGGAASSTPAGRNARHPSLRRAALGEFKGICRCYKNFKSWEQGEVAKSSPRS